MNTYEICVNVLLIITLVLAIDNEVKLAKVAYAQHKAVKALMEGLEDGEEELVEDDKTGKKHVEVRLHRIVEVEGDKEEKENRK